MKTDLVLQRLAHAQTLAGSVVDESVREELTALIRKIQRKWIMMSLEAKAVCRQDVLEMLDAHVMIFETLRGIGGMAA